MRMPKRTKEGLEDQLKWQKEILRRVIAGESLETMDLKPVSPSRSVDHWEKAIAETEALLLAFDK